MFHNNKSKGIVTAIMCGALACGAMSFSSRQQPKHNFQVLPQNISRDSLMTIMHGFNDALGVKCGFCHTQSAADTAKLDFASDAKKEKEYARHMMKITAGINSTYFNWANSAQPDTIKIVTCVTCHRGNEKPEK